MKSFRNLITQNKAVAAIEFAILAPVFFLLFMGIFEFGLTIFYDSSLNTGIRTVARQGIPRGTSATQIQTIMNTNLGGLYNSEKATFVVKAYNEFNDPAFIADKNAFLTDPDSFFTGAGAGSDPVIPIAQSGKIMLYGVRYEWGGITNLMTPFIPANLYAFSIVRNEEF